MRFEPLEDRQLLTYVWIEATRPNTSEEPGAEAGQFTVYRNDTGQQDLNVYFAVSGTATEGGGVYPADYDQLPDPGYPRYVTIEAGHTSVTMPVSVVNDAFLESNETVIVTLWQDQPYYGVHYVLGSPDNATVTIADNDNWLVKVQAVDPLAAEPRSESATADPGQFRFTRYTPYGETDLTHAITVYYTAGGTATNGTDYESLSGPVTIDEDEQSVLLNVTPLWDTVDDWNETFIATVVEDDVLPGDPIHYAVGDPSSAKVTIDDRAPNNPVYARPIPYGTSVDIGAQETDGTLSLAFPDMCWGYVQQPWPIIVVDTPLEPWNEDCHLLRVEVSLTLDQGQEGEVVSDTIYYDGSTADEGVLYRFAAQVDPGSLPTGAHPWDMTITEVYANYEETVLTFSGSKNIVNRSESEFGPGWWPLWLDGLVYVEDSDDVPLVLGDGNIFLFRDDGQGGYLPDPNYGALSGDWETGFTLTQRDGSTQEFNTSGLPTARADRNLNPTTYEYADGKLATVTDPAGRETTFTYTDGLLSEITDFALRPTTYDYDESGRLASITRPDPDGEGQLDAPVTYFDYDEDGRMTSVTDPMLRPTTFDYDSGGALKKITLPGDDSPEKWLSAVQVRTLVDLSQVGYDQYHLAPLTPASGDNVGDNLKGSWTDENGHTGKFEVDRYGNRTSYTCPYGKTAYSEYDTAGWLTRSIPLDPDGEDPTLVSPIVEYEYDQKGNVLQQTTLPDVENYETTVSWTYDETYSQVTSYTDESAHLTLYTLDAHGNVETMRRVVGEYGGDDDIVTEYTYTPAPQNQGDPPAGLVSTMTDPLGRVTEYEYNSHGLPTSITYAVGTDDEATVQYEYDSADNLTAEIDGLGHRTEYEYDDLGRRTKVTQPDPDGQGGNPAPVTDYEYDALGRQTKITLADPDGQGPLLARVTESVYNDQGLLWKTIQPDPDGAGSQTSPVTTYTYDPVGNLLTETDPRGNTTTYTYNWVNRRTYVTRPDPDGAGGQSAPVTHYGYDYLQRVTSMTDALGGVTTYTHDNLGRQVKITQPDPDGGGPGLSPFTENTYDLAGNLLTTKNALDETTTYQYDEFNRVLTVTDPEDGVTTYTYDKLGNRLSLTDPEGNGTTWEYDDLNRVKTETNELDDIRSFVYDAAGKLTQKTDRDGRVIQYTYDNLNRNTEELWKDGQTTVRTITFGYDELGRLSSEGDPDGVIAYAFDYLDRPTSITQTIDGLEPDTQMQYWYDAAGNCTYALAYLGGVYNTANCYTTYYDNLNRLLRVYQGGPNGEAAMKQVYFSWDNLDRLYEIDRYEYHAGTGWVFAVEDAYTYDHDSRLTGLTHYLRGTSNRPIYAWTYDQAGRPTAFTSSLDGTADYTYDTTSQLTGADYNYQTDETYTYDSNGNRTNTGYATGEANRLTCDGTYTYLYDAEGNRTARFIDDDSSGTLNTGDTDLTEYTWDYRNRLTSVTNRATYGGNATQLVDYIYDVNNQLVGKILDPDGDGELGTSEEYYAYDRGQIVFRFDGPTVADMTDRYLWAPAVDLLLSDEKVTSPTTPGDIYWALGDNLNTVRDIAHYDPQTDKTTVANHRVYDAFGNLTSETNSAVDLLFSFTGRPFDASTNLQNNLNRWYAAAVGRWASEDPIGFRAGDANLYRYVGNAPTNGTDPTGEDYYWWWPGNWYPPRPGKPWAPGRGAWPRAGSSPCPNAARHGWLDDFLEYLRTVGAYAVPGGPEAQHLAELAPGMARTAILSALKNRYLTLKGSGAPQSEIDQALDDWQNAARLLKGD